MTNRNHSAILTDMATLKELREACFLSQADLAKKAGTGVVTISRIERGLHYPRFRTIRQLAVALEVKPGDIEFQRPGQVKSVPEGGENWCV